MYLVKIWLPPYNAQIPRAALGRTLGRVKDIYPVLYSVDERTN